MKIVDYTVVSATDDEDLAAIVKLYIKDGWQPVGGAIIIPGPAHSWTCKQTMVKYEEPKDEYAPMSSGCVGVGPYSAALLKRTL